MQVFLAIPIGKAVSALVTAVVVGGLVLFGAGATTAVVATNPEILETARETVEAGEATVMVEAVSKSQVVQTYRENREREALKVENQRRNALRVVGADDIVRNGFNRAIGCAEGMGAVVVPSCFDAGNGYGLQCHWEIIDCLPSEQVVPVIGGCVAYDGHNQPHTSYPVYNGYTLGVKTPQGEWLGEAGLVYFVNEETGEIFAGYDCTSAGQW